MADKPELVSFEPFKKWIEHQEQYQQLSGEMAPLTVEQQRALDVLVLEPGPVHSSPLPSPSPPPSAPTSTPSTLRAVLPALHDLDWVSALNVYYEAHKTEAGPPRYEMIPVPNFTSPSAPSFWHGHCRLPHEAPLQTFPEAPHHGSPPPRLGSGTFVRKRDAKQYAARCAVEFLVANGLMAPLGGGLPAAVKTANNIATAAMATTCVTLFGTSGHSSRSSRSSSRNSNQALPVASTTPPAPLTPPAAAIASLVGLDLNPNITPSKWRVPPNLMDWDAKYITVESPGFSPSLGSGLSPSLGSGLSPSLGSGLSPSLGSGLSSSLDSSLSYRPAAPATYDANKDYHDSHRDGPGTNALGVLHNGTVVCPPDSSGILPSNVYKEVYGLLSARSSHPPDLSGQKGLKDVAAMPPQHLRQELAPSCVENSREYGDDEHDDD